MPNLKRYNLKRYNLNRLFAISDCVTFLVTAFVVVGCGASAKKQLNDQLTKTGADPTATPSPTPAPVTANYTIEISAPTPTALVTKATADIGDATCTKEFTVTVKDSGTAKSGVPVTLAVSANTTGSDTGTVSPTTGTTDASGQLKATYCAGDAESTVVIAAKAFDKQANTGNITTSKKSQYTFAYEGTEELPDSVGLTGNLFSFLSGENFLNHFALNSSIEDTGPAETVLNLFGSGRDRINLIFKVSGSGAAYAGASAQFVSQPDYPMGAKLALCSAVATTDTDPITGRLYLTYTSVSNAGGLFKVPVCAARMPGNLIVRGTLSLGTGNAAKTMTADAPAVRFEGGLASYGNMSVTFDTKNAKVLRSSFVTNTEEPLNFKVRIQSRMDGTLSSDNPLGVIAEYGKVAVANGGKPDESGSVQFTVEALNDFAQRPLRVTKPDISNGIDYDHMCTPKEFSATAPVPLSTLAKDWRSTVLYYVKGQEQFFDANYNGQYDATNSVGFWDRNQNGVFDCTPMPLVGPDNRICDEITYVNQDGAATDPNSAVIKSIKVGAYPMGAPAALCAGAAGCLNTAQQQAMYKYDWFVDMPTPFVDSDENGDHRDNGTPRKDQIAEYVVGESFHVPNGKWDREGYVWKSFVLPVFAGASPYSLTHRVISSDLDRVFALASVTGTANDYDKDATGAAAGLAAFFKAGKYDNELWNPGAANATGKAGVVNTLFGCINTSGGAGTANEICNDAALDFGVIDSPRVASRYFFAQGTCGTPLPGGSTIATAVTPIAPANPAGPRVPLVHFYMQPNDWTLEPHRRLLSESGGGSSAKINFDPTSHAAKDFGYPVQFQVELPACLNPCAGDLKDAGGGGAGIYCDMQSGVIDLTVSYSLGGTPGSSETIRESYSVGQTSTCVCATGALFSRGTCKCPSGQTNKGGSCSN